MNTDDLLSNFRSEIHLPDDASARRIYARATRTRRRLPQPKLVFAVATIVVAGGGAGGLAAALVGGNSTVRTATGTWNHATGAGDIPRRDMFVHFARSKGTLTSVALTLTPYFADARIELQVQHSDASTYAEAYTEWYSGGTQVVFKEQEPTAGTGSWSSTLSPSEWSGGCGSGLYKITWVAVGPGGSLAGAMAAYPNGGSGAGTSQSEADSTAWFRCATTAGPPTGGYLDAGSVWTPSAANPYGRDGKQVTMDQLLADAPTLPLPDSPLANAHSAGTVWEASPVSAAVYYPSSRIELLVVRGTISTSGTGLPPGTVRTIDGLPALVYPGSPDASPPVPAQVLIGLSDGRVLELVGFRPADDLVGVAETLSPAPR